MSGITTEDPSATAVVAPANALHCVKAVSPLADCALTDAGTSVQLAVPDHAAPSATVAGIGPMFAEDQLSCWDTGHNLPETLMLQLAADVTNLSAKDAHGFTVL